MSDAPTTLPTCPECGWTDDGSLPRPLRLLHPRRVVPLLVVLLAIGGLVTWASLDRDPGISNSGRWAPQLLDPGWSGDDVERVASASAASAGRSLARHLRAVATRPPLLPPGPIEIDVAWGVPGASRTDVRERGWPVPWRTVTETATYEDALSRRGLVAATTDESLEYENPWTGSRDATRVPARPRWTWADGMLVHQPAPEDAGGVDRRTILEPAALALPLALVAVAWVGVRGGLAVVERLRRRPIEPRARHTATLVALLPVVLGAGAMLLASDAQGFIRAAPMDGGRWLRGTPLGLTVEDLAPAGTGMRADERAVASRVLAALGPAPGPEARLAAAPAPAWTIRGNGWDAPAAWVLGGFDHVTYQEGERGKGPIVAPPAGLDLELGRGLLVLRWSSGDPADRPWAVHVSLARIALVAVGLVLLGAAAAAITRAVAGRAGARSRVEGRCLRCGHQVTALAPGGPENP